MFAPKKLKTMNAKYPDPGKMNKPALLTAKCRLKKYFFICLVPRDANRARSPLAQSNRETSG
jgi:hypothetical protein